MTAIKLGIQGAAGRMGKRLVALGTEDKELTIAAGFDAPNHPLLGEDVGTLAGIGAIGIPLTPRLEDEVDAVIDFSLPEATDYTIETCVEQKTALVFATTGISDAQKQKLQDASREIPLMWAPNMSLAVNLTMKLAQVAGQALKDKDADVEILERHHRYKADSPSGTALEFGRLIAEQMGISNEVHGREGRVGQRPHDEIGYHAIRVGDNPGEHTIVFGMLGETIELTVRATNRDCYAFGALACSKWLVKQPAGLYSMKDFLGL